MNESANKLSAKVVSEMETLIRDAISTKIGSSDWCITDMAGRIAMSTFPDKTEVILFDGQELIRFFPVETSVESSGTGFRMVASRKYQIMDS